MWESRHGFPRPTRRDSGHRRYDEHDVELVLQVLRRRDDGMRLEVAIAGVALAEASVGAPPGAPSVYATLRRLHPALHAAAADEVHAARAVVGDRGRVLLAGRAADDLRRLPAGALLPGRPGALGRAGPGLPLDDGVRRLQRRARRRSSGTTFVDLPDDAPMRREWAVVCDAEDYPAMLTAWELPGQSTVPDGKRLFEAIWTVEPAAVRDAARACAQVAQQLGHPEGGTAALRARREPAAAPGGAAAGHLAAQPGRGVRRPGRRGRLRAPTGCR